MAYGFKVFTLEAHLNNRGEAAAWSKPLADHLWELLEQLASRGPIKGTPKLRSATQQAVEETPEAFAAERHPPSTWFRDLVRINERHLHFVMSTGVYGDHQDLARDEGTEPEDIGDAAATARYRVDVLVPGDGSPKALVIVESIGVRAPIKLLRLFLTDASRSRAPKDPKTGTRRGTYYGFRAYGQPDGAHVMQLISTAESAKAVFRDTRRTARGRTKEVLRSLEISLTKKKYRDAAVRTAEAWARGLLADHDDVDAEGDAVSEVDAIAAMKADFDVSDQGLTALDFEVDDVALVIQSKGGSPKWFTPSLVRQLFIYPVTTYEPSDDSYYRRVTAKVEDLEKQYGLGIEVPVLEEVLTCLTASALDHSSEAASAGSGDELT